MLIQQSVHYYHTVAGAKLDCVFTTPMLSQNFTLAVSVRNLWVTFDNNIIFKHHICETWGCCFYHIHDLRRIRRYMSFFVAIAIATAFVSSRFDYFNSPYHNIAFRDIMKLRAKLFGNGSRQLETERMW